MSASPKKVKISLCMHNIYRLCYSREHLLLDVEANVIIYPVQLLARPIILQVQFKLNFVVNHTALQHNTVGFPSW